MILSVISDEPGTTMALIERPLSNSKMYDASISGARALETTLNVLEELKIGYNYCDSKEWQRVLIPGFKINTPNPELKKRSLEIGKRMYPQLNFEGFKDADGILIATYLKSQWDIIEPV